MKYVTFTLLNGAKFPVVFSEQLCHADVHVEGAQPTSAGFCGLDPSGKMQVSGESASLKLKLAEHDVVLLEHTLTGAESLLILDNLEATMTHAADQAGGDSLGPLDPPAGLFADESWGQVKS